MSCRGCSRERSTLQLAKSELAAAARYLARYIDDGPRAERARTRLEKAKLSVQGAKDRISIGHHCTATPTDQEISA